MRRPLQVRRSRDGGSGKAGAWHSCPVILLPSPALQGEGKGRKIKPPQVAAGSDMKGMSEYPGHVCPPAHDFKQKSQVLAVERDVYGMS